MSKLGDFQANVGIYSADVGLIGSYIVAGIMIIAGILLAILAFVPMAPGDCNKASICLQYGNNSNKCKVETDRCNKKTKNYGLLFFLLLIPLAIGLVLYNRWWKNYVHTNKTAAQIGGTLFEMNQAANLFKNL